METSFSCLPYPCLWIAATFTLLTIWFVVHRYVFAVLYLHQYFVLHNFVHIVQLSCSVGSLITGGGWRYLLGVLTHLSCHPPPWSKQKVVGKWRERWCLEGTPSPTCWRQSVEQSGCTEEVPWREADGWVWMLLCLCVCIIWIQVWSCPYVCICVYVFECTMIGCWAVLFYKLISSVRGHSFLLLFCHVC